MLRKAVCSLNDTEPILMLWVIYPFHPPMVLVSILKEALSRKSKERSGAVIFRPVSIITCSRVGVIGPWPNKKALIASDQKKEDDMSIGSFLTISDRDKLRHWLMSYCSQVAQ